VELHRWLNGSGRIVIAGVGSPMRRDDAVGFEIVRRLKGRVEKNILLIECETVPENYIGKIEEFKPTHVLIIDAGQLHLKPGRAQLVAPDRIAGVAISTHTLPLNIFAEYVSRSTGAKIALLAIQPLDLGLGEGLTSDLEESVETLANFLLRTLSSRK